MRQNSSTSQPIVSVIIPAFNAEATLAQTIQSVFAQTRGDWEMIVVDDGSSDATTSIVAHYAHLNRRVRLISQSNKGPSAARNNGVMRARGDIVAFLDADDTWQPEHLEKAVDLLKADDQLGVAFAPCTIVDDNGRDTGQRTRPFTNNVAITDVLAGNPTATCSSLVARRSVFFDAGFMREDMVHAEDQEWLFRVVLSGWKIRSHGMFLVNYRCNPRGLSSDVAHMFAGWKTFVELAKRSAPLITHTHLPSATASMHFYYVRRLVRDGNLSAETLQHFYRAWRACPLTATKLTARLLAAAAIKATSAVLGGNATGQMARA